MKYIFRLLLFTILISPAFSLEIEEFEGNQFILDSLLASLESPEAPRIHGDYIVFTADASARYTGIAFDFNEYGVVHSFRRFVQRDTDGNEESSVLFYILKPPVNAQQISYRLVIDGLWTTDPENPTQVYDKASNLLVSKIALTNSPEISTETTEKDTVRFIYEGESGQRIRLGGNFTNWDSFIYELTETNPGFYQLELALPKGTYYYAYYKGINSFVDNKNPSKAYTPDGRIASVITVN